MWNKIENYCQIINFMSSLGKRTRSSRSFAYLPAPKRQRIQRRKRTSALSTASKLGIEKKNIDYTGSASLPTSLANARIDLVANTPLNGIAQGDDDHQRDGRRATLASVHVKCLVQTNTINAATVRMLLVMDDQCNGQLPQPDDVLADKSNTQLNLVTWRNLDNTNRFKILKDKLVHINPAIGYDTSGTGTQIHSNPSQLFEMNVKLNDVVNYSGTGSTVASINDKALYLFLLSDQTGSYHIVSRVRFYG